MKTYTAKQVMTVLSHYFESHPIPDGNLARLNHFRDNGYVTCAKPGNYRNPYTEAEMLAVIVLFDMHLLGVTYLSTSEFTPGICAGKINSIRRSTDAGILAYSVKIAHTKMCKIIARHL